MPLFTPGRRWQPAFFPFKKENSRPPDAGSRRANDQGTALRMPDVRQLRLARDSADLLYGVSQRAAQRPLRRFDS